MQHDGILKDQCQILQYNPKSQHCKYKVGEIQHSNGLWDKDLTDFSKFKLSE